MICDCGVVVVKPGKKAVLSCIYLEIKKALVLRKEEVSCPGHLAGSKKTSA